MEGGFSDATISLLSFSFVIPAYAFQIALSIFFGLMIGIEREIRGKPASLRTGSGAVAAQGCSPCLTVIDSDRCMARSAVRSVTS